MMDKWVRPAEDVALALTTAGVRVVGVTAPVAGSGVSTLARMIARSLTQAKLRTLVLDLSGPVRADANGSAWAPGAGGAGQMTRRHESGFDLLVANPTPETRAIFNNSTLLKAALSEEFAQYAAVVIDLPAVLPDRDDVINPCGVALSCQALLLICPKWKVRRDEVKEAHARLASVGAQVTGVVFNNFGEEPTFEEIAGLLQRSKWIPSRVSNWAARKLRGSQTLQ
jgi:Mrp family chromosome partitioning ATPase